MLKRLAILTVLCPLAAIGILAGQNAPKRAPEQGIGKPSGGQVGQHQAGTQDHGQNTPNPPSVHIQATAPVDETAKEEGRQNLKIQGELALFTGLLVFVGFLQAGTMIWQARLLHKHSEHFEELATRMRDQVEISRKALVAQFRPKIVVRSIRFDPSSVEEFDQRTNPSWRIEISIVNVGDTVAHVTRCEAISFWMDNLRRSRADIATNEWEPYSLQPGETKRLILPVEQRDFRTSLHVVESAIKRTNESQEFPVCKGYIFYTDENGHTRETGFERRWNIHLRRFIASEDPESEYSE